MYPIIFILSIIAAFFEYWQHREHRNKYPDCKPCPANYGVFIVFAVLSLIGFLKG